MRNWKKNAKLHSRLGLDKSQSNYGLFSTGQSWRSFLKLLYIGLFVTLIGLSCNFPTIVAGTAIPFEQDISPTPPNRGTPGIGTFTPTPFLPLDKTPVVLTPTLEPTPLWGSYPGPSVPPSIPIPPPVESFKQPAGQVNILLLGSDQRPGGGGFRTDTILLITLNPILGTANVTSFPRDLYVYIPGWTMQRLNTAQQKGGFLLTQATFEYNFGIRPDHFLMVNFWGFVQGIDNLGGINVHVGRTISDHRDGLGTYTVPSGLVHMDGDTVLWYVRARSSSNDFDRNRRQQEVILAIFNRLLSLNAIQRAPELFNLYQENVTTDLTLRDITPLLGLATLLENRSSNINSYFIGPSEVQAFRVPSSGAQVLLPKPNAVSGIMRQALNAQ